MKLSSDFHIHGVTHVYQHIHHTHNNNKSVKFTQRKNLDRKNVGKTNLSL